MLSNLVVFVPIFVLYFSNNFVRYLTKNRYNVCPMCVSIFGTEIFTAILYLMGINFIPVALFTFMLGMSVIAILSLVTKGTLALHPVSRFPVMTTTVYLTILVVALLV